MPWRENTFFFVFDILKYQKYEKLLRNIKSPFTMMSGQWKGSQVFCDFSHNINALAGTLQILALPASSSSKYTQNQIQIQKYKDRLTNTKIYNYMNTNVSSVAGILQIRGAKTQNFPGSNFLRAKTFQTKCVKLFLTTSLKSGLLTLTTLPKNV